MVADAEMVDADLCRVGEDPSELLAAGERRDCRKEADADVTDGSTHFCAPGR
jgi:hypothetical protein